jgi:hypothetical protein
MAAIFDFDFQINIGFVQLLAQSLLQICDEFNQSVFLHVVFNSSLGARVSSVGSVDNIFVFVEVWVLLLLALDYTHAYILKKIENTGKKQTQSRPFVRQHMLILCFRVLQ